MPISEPVELKLRITRSKKQGEGKLVDYMMNHPTSATADVVMEACRAYWMPLAFAQMGESNEAVLRSVGWKAIGELEAQIKLIIRVLQLEQVPSESASKLLYSARSAADNAVPTPNREQIQTPEELDEELGESRFLRKI